MFAESVNVHSGNPDVTLVSYRTSKCRSGAIRAFRVKSSDGIYLLIEILLPRKLCIVYGSHVFQRSDLIYIRGDR